MVIPCSVFALMPLYVEDSREDCLPIMIYTAYYFNVDVRL